MTCVQTVYPLSALTLSATVFSNAPFKMSQGSSNSAADDKKALLSSKGDQHNTNVSASFISALSTGQSYVTARIG